MDRTLWERHLTLARAHVAVGQRNVARQRKLLAKLDLDGHPTELARRMLKTYEDLLALMLEDALRIREDLSRPNPAR